MADWLLFHPMDEGLVPYELERASRIRSNQQRLHELGIPALVAAIASPSPAKPVREKKPKTIVPESQRRRSSRARPTVQYAEDPTTPPSTPRVRTSVAYRTIPIQMPVIVQLATLWLPLLVINELLVGCASAVADALQVLGLDPEHIRQGLVGPSVALSQLLGMDSAPALSLLQRMALETVFSLLSQPAAAAAAPVPVAPAVVVPAPAAAVAAAVPAPAAPAVVAPAPAAAR